MKIIMYFIVFCCISASGVVGGGEKSLVWTSISETTTMGSRLNQLPRNMISKGNRKSMSGAARSLIQRNGEWRSGELVVRGCQGPTNMGSGMRGAGQALGG